MQESKSKMKWDFKYLPTTKLFLKIKFMAISTSFGWRMKNWPKSNQVSGSDHLAGLLVSVSNKELNENVDEESQLTEYV